MIQKAQKSLSCGLQPLVSHVEKTMMMIYDDDPSPERTIWSLRSLNGMVTYWMNNKHTINQMFLIHFYSFLFKIGFFM